MFKFWYLATKGKGLLGKTSWSDEEDEDGEEVAADDVGQLPNIDQKDCGEDIVIQAKNQRVTLMARPQMPVVSNDDSEPCKLNVIYISNISQDDAQVNSKCPTLKNMARLLQAVLQPL